MQHVRMLVILIVLVCPALCLALGIYYPANIENHPACWIDGDRVGLRFENPHDGTLSLVDSALSGTHSFKAMWVGHATIDTVLNFDELRSPYVFRMPEEAPGTLKGTVIDRKGRPIPQWRIEIPFWGEKGYQRKAEDACEIELPPGVYEATVSLYHHRDDKLITSLTKTVSIQSGQNTEQLFRLPVKIDGRITGVVTDSAGNRQEGVIVTLSGRCDSTETDRKGRFEIKNLLPGTYSLVVGGLGHKRVRTHVDIKNLSDHANFELVSVKSKYGSGFVDLVIPDADLIGNGNGKITGTIIDEWGDGALGAAVQLLETSQGVGIINFDGSYSILGIAPGIYTVRISSIDYGPIIVDDVQVLPGTTTRLDAVMAEEQLYIDGGDCW